MIEISNRYALAMAILSALALLPEFVHRGPRFLREDCRDPGALLRSAGADAGAAPPPPEALRRLPNTQHSARRLSLPEGQGQLDFHVVNGFNPSLIYQPAELYFVEDRKPDRREVEMLEHDGVRLPVHRAHWEQRGPRRQAVVTGYLRVFDSKPVRSAYRAELLAGPSQLFSGRKPVWLFFVHGEVKPGAREAAEKVLHETLASAWDEYQAACLPP